LKIVPGERIIVIPTAEKTLDGDFVSGVIDRTSGIRIQTIGHGSIGFGLGIGVQTGSITEINFRIFTAFRPGIVIFIHEIVLILLPNTISQMFEELFKPFGVFDFFEVSQELPIGIGHVTIALFAVGFVGAHGVTRTGVPFFGVGIKELVFANALARVIKIDVL